MFTPQVKIHRGARDEAEKPFWISYADLMTSLMVLFLIVMVAALAVLSIVLQQAKVDAARYDKVQASLQAARAQEQRLIQDIIRQTRQRFPGIAVAETGDVNLGVAATFRDGRSTLRSPRTVGRYIDWLARRVSLPDGQIIERVTIEGGASVKGDYLYNLDLSMDRGMQVLCAGLLQPSAPRLGIRQLFFVGGNSFAGGSTSAVRAQGRNARLRIEFRPIVVNSDGTVGRERRTVNASGSRQPTGPRCWADYG